MAKNLANQYQEYNRGSRFKNNSIESNKRLCSNCGTELVGRKCSNCEKRDHKQNKTKHKKPD
jgi:hypothetical protein